jgi:S1-C subfamily serine protease
MQALVASLLSLLLLAPIAQGWLGVYLSGENDEPVIAEVIPNSPAANAGMKAGDVLLAVGDTKTETSEEFVAAIRAGKPGDRVNIKLRRDGKEMTVVVKLGEPPSSPAEGGTKPPKESAPKGQKPPQPAVELAPESKALAPAQAGKGYLGLAVRETGDGVVVENVRADGPAKGAGVEAGDILTSVGDQLVKDLGDLDRFLSRAQAGQKVTLGLRRGEETRSVALRMGERPAQMDVVPVAPIRPAEPETVPAPKESKRLRAAPAPAPEPNPHAQPKPHTEPKQAADLEAELLALRAELAKLRQELEELRKSKGRE